MSAHEVLFEQRGRLGAITLNRPRAINALTHGMVTAITAQLQRWLADDAVSTIAITGAGERGLCAGGDVVSLYRAAIGSEYEAASQFWRDEYRMIALIASAAKPVVAVQDGIVLGGGIGISGHASHRVVTERSRLGFPETTIGFIPDVGASWLLGRAPGGAGIRLGLTAEPVGAADALHIGFADAFVHSQHLEALLTALETEEPDAVLTRLGGDAGESALAADADGLDAAFRLGSVTAIIDALRAAGADELVDGILSKSPTALAATLESLHRATELESLEAALEREFLVSMHSLTTPDFAEGIRAQLVDKDRRPTWQPAALEDVDADDIAAFFVPGPAGSLVLGAASTTQERS